ncbi:hypothetical protein [Marinitenerispora sediminis]|uniref:Uncharacterized protein n=1 Tax=Marinitenerispora sediminis TaxID=1931232 RepID=A0A368SYE5_9ACTN|nr:hypothetical protein [Marinitenerispora sediminis]RCV48983.1 hypothetical protein DEF24_25705 [Marinitenerispora sediminis]RCV50984.1 hypothetical protein DEF23_21265 [Marinitenerispora sediminis]RCV53221.1 hypothetical protein DEF28_10790 [Marinitenerispora sediminis]
MDTVITALVITAAVALVAQVVHESLMRRSGVYGRGAPGRDAEAAEAERLRHRRSDVAELEGLTVEKSLVLKDLAAVGEETPPGTAARTADDLRAELARLDGRLSDGLARDGRSSGATWFTPAAVAVAGGQAVLVAVLIALLATGL